MNVLNFFLSILLHSNAQTNCGSEGNSGEFHSEKEEERLNKLADEALLEMLKQFHIVTGYLPVYKETYNGEIVFFKERLTTSENLSYIIDEEALTITMYSGCTYSEKQGAGYYHIGIWTLQQ